MTERDIKEIVRQTVEETLTSLGVEHDSPLEMQKDFQHLREWRKSMESVKAKGLIASVGFILTGLLAVLLVGFKDVIWSATH